MHARLSPAWQGADSNDDAPVVLLLHGLGSDENDLPSLASFLPDGLAWASLRAPVEMEWGGASWFPLTSPVEPDQEGVDAATEAIWRWVEAHVPPSAPLVPLGFSQGAFMALELLRARPERIRATVVLSGLMAEDERVTDTALATKRPVVFWGRGVEDTRIWPQAVDRLAAWLHAHTALTERVYAGLGHAINDAEMADVGMFMATHVTASSRG
jgi:phospholipase/carboxylesterase